MLDRAIALRHPGDKRVAGHGALKAAGIVRVAGFIGFHVLVVRLLDALLARLCNFGVHLLAQLAAQSFGAVVGQQRGKILPAGVQFIFGTRGAHVLVRVGHLGKGAFIVGIVAFLRALFELGDLLVAQRHTAALRFSGLRHALHGQIHAAVAQGDDRRVIQLHAIHAVDLIVVRPLEIEIIKYVRHGHGPAVVFRQHRFADIVNSSAIFRDLHEGIDADEVAARQRQAQRGHQRRSYPTFPVHNA